MRKFVQFFFIATILCLLLPTISNAQNVTSLSFSSTNVTTSAYVEFVASSPISVGNLQLCNSSSVVMKVAKGAASSEIDIFMMPVSSCVQVSTYLEKGTRLSLRAISGTANSGYGAVSFLQ